MRRRRARSREIVFNFDSFLDLVANVVGIILRLILVVWIGARSYSYVVEAPAKQKPPAAGLEQLAAEKQQARDESQKEERLIAKLNAEWHVAQQELAQLSAASEEAQDTAANEQGRLRQLDAQMKALQDRLDALRDKERTFQAQSVTTQEAKEDLVRKQRELKEKINRLPKEPAPKKNVLRYQTPVAAVIQSQELQFECSAGRVTFLDVEALLSEIKDRVHSKADDLRHQWRVTDETNPVGAFRLRYVVSRQKTVLDSIAGGGGPNANDDFRYGLDRWTAEPITEERGESIEEALRPASELRKIIDRIDPETTAVTFWVYPDSFAIYRRLRDYCARKGIMVAGRPLPPGVPIASSRHGSASRGQ